ncbi:Leucine-rich repeat serine/threonine-protein kinase 2 [Phytophthora pseudosyringae]|uniref:Leucine-rich repeat serine/threonine-protein kinase 2 n=1 Tax=Phytophthora pseudosyringae TaxID=221518 RepID=A0A8T1V7H0_9STRA|nr:Leucine-rich repeat serine/threonine-protein kinase 2 [Phytophthora pseudosyringae]
MSSLPDAVKEGNLTTIYTLVEQGASVNSSDRYGKTPLTLADRWGHLEIVKCRVGNGATLRDTLLQQAAGEGHFQVVKYLVENGADVNAKDEYGDTLLQLAAGQGRLGVVKYLVGNGTDGNAKNEDGGTSLLRATYQGRLGVMKYLVDNGADVSTKDKDGSTPLILASGTRGGRLDIVQYLVKNGADVNVKNEFGATPLREAVRCGHLEVVQYLVENGADVNAKTEDGTTTLSVARSLAMVQFLVNQGDANMQRDWVIPGNQVVLHQHEMRGSYQLGEWLGAKVVIQPVALSKVFKSSRRLSREAEVWHRLYHPHIVMMFGACYLENNPFIVCEYAPNGQLIEYLTEHPNETWRKLYEVALGLCFLHRMRVVHGDLKCSNILIGSDGFAKLTGFGLSSTEALADTDKDNKNRESSGIFGWALLKRNSAFESDLYSFGLCIIEAVTGHRSRRTRLLAAAGTLPKRTKQFTDAQWNLVERLCRSKTNHDLSAIDLVQELRVFVDEKQGEETNYSTFDHGEIDGMLQQIQEYVGTDDADRMSRQVYERLSEVSEQLRYQNVSEAFFWRYFGMLEAFSKHMRPGSSLSASLCSSATVLKYAMSRQVANDASFFHHKIDRFMAAASLSTSADIHNWRTGWDHVRQEQNQKFMNKAQSANTLLEDIPEEECEEVLTNLRYQLSKNYINYETSASEGLTRARAVISNLCKAKGMLYESWFIPESDVEFDKHTNFASGGFGSVHHGKWLDARVVIKTVDLKQVHNSREMFLREVKVWHKLYHPHIVQMYGACHVGKPFIICAYAPNGQLDEYLKKHPTEVWRKLYEAALGLLYLHRMRVVHGDLKCNNILIGADGFAKLTDFGLSSIEALEESDRNDGSKSETFAVGAVRWKAPEVLNGAGATFESDVYSFGMCIIEAVSGNYPWGSLQDAAVTYWVKDGAIPKRPGQCTDDQWRLVKQLCKYEPSNRLPIVDAVKALKGLAG